MIAGSTQSKNLIIAITGGIGSGKSTALDIVEKLGYKSFNADFIYNSMLLNEDFVCQISSLFGISPICDNGKKRLDKEKISQIVFSSKDKLKTLNDFTHPIIMGEMIKRAKEEKGLVFCEVPLLYEGGFENLFDYVFVLKRDDELRFLSASNRDGKSVEKIRSIAKNQFDYSKIIADEKTYIIYNDGDLSSLKANLQKAINAILSK